MAILGCLRGFWVAQLVKNPPAMQETLDQLLGQKFPWRRDSLPTPVLLGFLVAQMVKKKSACNSGDLDLIPGLGRSPEGGHRNPLPVFLPGESPWTEEPGGLQSMGCKESDMTEQLSRAQAVWDWISWAVWLSSLNC